MTIKECIDIVDSIKPNQYTIKDKVMWLSFIDEIIINEVLKTHEGYDGRYDSFEGYTEDKISVKLIVPSPYDRLYTAYLKMQIDKENGETARYNNSMVIYNTYMQEYRKHYNKTHMPLDITAKRISVNSSIKPTQGLSEAEYENLKRDLTFILTEYFNDTVSPDKLNDAITKYAQNNMEMLKGKDGETPIKGVHYWNDADKDEINGYVNNRASEVLGECKRYTEKLVSNLERLVDSLYAKSLAKTITINLPASAWVNDGTNRYSQVVSIADITANSKVDLQPTTEQLMIFYEKDITFVTENENGVVTVYCIGQKPTMDYDMQATITEVETDE